MVLYRACVGVGSALCQRALRLNKESAELWLFFFWLEIDYVQRLKQRKEALGLLDSLDEKDRMFLQGWPAPSACRCGLAVTVVWWAGQALFHGPFSRMPPNLTPL